MVSIENKGSFDRILFEKDQMQFSTLMRELVLQQTYMSRDKSKIWLVLDVNDEFSAKSVVATLPYCSVQNYTIIPLTQ